ncbi:MAG: hypothetical protein AAFQ98_22075, partial [Bacteroidota bacterium]
MIDKEIALKWMNPLFVLALILSLSFIPKISLSQLNESIELSEYAINQIEAIVSEWSTQQQKSFSPIGTNGEITPDLLNRVILNFRTGNMDSVLILTSGISTMSSHYDTSLVFGLSVLEARAMWKKGFWEEALNQYETILKVIGKQTEHRSTHKLIHVVLSSLYLEHEQYSKAISLGQAWLKHWRKQSDIRLVASVYHNLGVSYFQIENYDSALFFLEAGLHEFEALTDTSSIVRFNT